MQNTLGDIDIWIETITESHNLNPVAAVLEHVLRLHTPDENAWVFGVAAAEVIATANGHPSPHEFLPLPPDVLNWAQQPHITPDEAMISQARKLAVQVRGSNALQMLSSDWDETIDNLLSRL